MTRWFEWVVALLPFSLWAQGWKRWAGIYAGGVARRA